MRLRTDHVTGGFFTIFGLAVLALSGDLPVGSLAMPGAGMMPKLAAALMILFGLTLVLRARESAAFATIDWGDLKHAGPVAVLTALATAAYDWLGFAITMTLLIFTLLTAVERRNVVPAAIFSAGLTALTYVLFVVALKSPLEKGVFGFPP